MLPVWFSFFFFFHFNLLVLEVFSVVVGFPTPPHPIPSSFCWGVWRGDGDAAAPSIAPVIKAKPLRETGPVVPREVGLGWEGKSAGERDRPWKIPPAP